MISSPASRASAVSRSGWRAPGTPACGPRKNSYELGDAPRPDVLGEVGSAGTQHPRDLAPPDGGRMPAGHQIEARVGERQRRFVGIGHHDDTAGVQAARSPARRWAARTRLPPSSAGTPGHRPAPRRRRSGCPVPPALRPSARRAAAGSPTTAVARSRVRPARRSPSRDTSTASASATSSSNDRVIPPPCQNRRTVGELVPAVEQRCRLASAGADGSAELLHRLLVVSSPDRTRDGRPRREGRLACHRPSAVTSRATIEPGPLGSASRTRVEVGGDDGQAEHQRLEQCHRLALVIAGQARSSPTRARIA